MAEQFQREAPPVRVDARGVARTEWTLTEKSVTDPVRIVVPPTRAVPIVFVPGIMGSNLMANAANLAQLSPGTPVWLVDGAAGMGKAWAFRGAAIRQRKLNPAGCDVYGGGKVPDSVPGIGDAETIRKTRFWGEVSNMSYMEFLVWLEDALNGRDRLDRNWMRLTAPDIGAAWGAHKTFEKLAREQAGHGANFRFPVYACGYNWLQSNLDSARRLKTRIEEILKACSTPKHPCDKAILVTHSMGGLVARACSELLGMRDKIVGIVHGVMPAVGAAAAYRRCRAGTEGAAGVVLGPDAATVSAVFANSPGAMQLLPTKDYPKGWLKIGQDGRNRPFRQVAALPEKDPYAEIYEVRGKWWALMREELVNPASIRGHRGWPEYELSLKKAKGFHDDLGIRYHPNTFAFFGEDSGPVGLTYGTVNWQGGMEGVRPGQGQGAGSSLYDRAQLLGDNVQSGNDSGTGVLTVRVDGKEAVFQVARPESPGDGTVPECSGRAPVEAGAQQVFALRGFGHEGAYDAPLARDATLYAILKIAQSVKVPA